MTRMGVDLLITREPSNVLYISGFQTFAVFGGETVIITREPEHGTLGSVSQLETGTQQLAQWIASYTPDADFSGNDFIKYIVSNPNNSNGSSRSKKHLLSPNEFF